MFFMTNDGGSPSKVILETEAILTQRVSIFGMLSQGIPVVLLRGAEFRDSKVCFVAEERCNRILIVVYRSYLSYSNKV